VCFCRIHLLAGLVRIPQIFVHIDAVVGCQPVGLCLVRDTMNHLQHPTLSISPKGT
jgi:hypothetical protein